MQGPSPLLGYNTNVRHKGKLYHIQTEDSGVKRPHILTHLFADGGRIVASTKTSYAEHVGKDDYPAIVKKLMQEQHKAMFIALRDGVYDASEEAITAAAAAKAEAKEKAEPAKVEPAKTEHAPATAKMPAPPKMRSSRPPPAKSEPPKPVATPAGKLPSKPPAAKMPPKGTTSSVDALERAAARLAAGGRGSRTPNKSSDRPNPTGTGKYSTTQPATASSAPRRNESIFGNEVLSEKTLDEVILGYLAEDLEDDR